MIGAIAGDIVGSRFEGNLHPPKDFRLFHEICRFTDDTVCTIAVADALLGELDFAASLRALYRRHPHRGYGGMFRQWATKDDALDYGSWGNGAPMRVSAVGWFAQSEEEVIRLAKAQACVTHSHPDAIRGAQAVALGIFMARQGATAKTIAQRLVADFEYDLNASIALKGGKFDVSAAGTVPAAMVSALQSDSWEDAVRTAVALGGDTDTLACIAGSIAEAIHGMPPDLTKVARKYLSPDLLAIVDRFEARTPQFGAQR